MENRSEKRRDMARSILPCKNRKSAREALARTKRNNRRAIRQELSMLREQPLAVAPIGGDDPSSDWWDERSDLRRYPNAEIRVAVRWRRNGDKLNHFIRWAIATTADLPIDDRMPHLQSILGSGLIGEHALLHLADEADLRRPQHHDRYVWRRHWPTPEEIEAQHSADLDLLRMLLRQIVEVPDGLAGLNRCMKTCDQHRTYERCVEWGCVKRCLAGVHDIDRFLHDVASPLGDRLRDGAPELLPSRRLQSYLRQLRTAAALDPARTKADS